MTDFWVANVCRQCIAAELAVLTVLELRLAFRIGMLAREAHIMAGLNFSQLARSDGNDTV